MNHYEEEQFVKKMTFRRNRLLVAAAATAVLATLVAPSSTAGAAVPAAGSQTVYDAVLDTLPPNLPSQAFQAQQTAEFGDHIRLAAGSRNLQSATVTMSTWAPRSEWTTDLSSTGWQHPITLTIYNVNSGPVPALGRIVGTVTQTMDIPWRPEHTLGCAAGRWSPDGDASTNCFGGLAFNVEFNLSTIGTVPDQIIYGIAYNTQTWGYTPRGTAGPYDSLNVALIDTSIHTSLPEAGTDAEPDAVFWNTMTPGNYSDGGTGGTGTFRRDGNWTPYTPAVEFTASANGCSFTQSGIVLTLQSDCQTDQTILVPNGFTLNGAGHTITAVDPSGGHFVGAVVGTSGTSASVTNLRVTASNLADICDGGADRLRGILFDNAAGSITNNVVTGVRQGLSGCQEGNAIEVRNFVASTTTPASPRLAVTISGNTVDTYQKNGITTNGGVNAMISDNKVTGAGPITYIAQNGIQVGFGAKGNVKSNTVSGNDYTPPGTEACGILLYEATAGVQKNVLSGNEIGFCNYGTVRGKFKPAL